MSEFCACNSTLKNTGTPDKQRVVESGSLLIAVPIKANDGTFNAINSTDVIDEAYVQAKINEADESKRWYPIGTFKNQEDVRADPITETFTDGSSGLTQQGVRTYTGWLLNYAPVYLETLESFKCQKFGLYVVDSCGGLTGSISKDRTKLLPTRVNEKMWNPTYTKGTPTVFAKVQLVFEFDQLERDKDLRVISDSEIDVDLLKIQGLLPLNAAITSPSTTGFVAKLTVDFDVFLEGEKEVVPAWVLADFALQNKTTNSAITITSVTEAPEGTYTFVIPAQSASDVLELTNVRTSSQKPGFFLEQEISIP